MLVAAAVTTEQPQAFARHAVALAGPVELGGEAAEAHAVTFTVCEGLPHALAGAAHDEHPCPGGRQMPGEHEAEPGRASRHDHPPVVPHGMSH